MGVNNPTRKLLPDKSYAKCRNVPKADTNIIPVRMYDFKLLIISPKYIYEETGHNM